MTAAVAKPQRFRFQEVRRSTDNPWLTKFAAFTALATLCLIGVGGLVTSKGVGMSVPDWPTTYGYNMFLFPISQWVGGIREEHSHRLFASWVGMLTTILAVWIFLKEERRWLRWLGVIAFVGVVLQGVLGGMRVVLKMDGLGIPHAALAQGFLCLLVAISLFLSRWWQKNAKPQAAVSEVATRLKPFFLATTVIIFLQLMIGATMRHQHAGLAVPDFPLAYGKVWPDTDPSSVARYNQSRLHDTQYNAITAGQIHLHMTHRLTAFLILGLVATCWWKARPYAAVRKLTDAWLALILLQAVLGVVTVLKNKPADIATAHVVVGAASLALGALISIMLARLSQTRAAQIAPALKPAFAES
ncbi:MAG TPA: COX15/CtaA family protein [Verrucomicrobiae bacterium]|nr:COX15/CtaA family protein [Verrucomicrobiae bacterium]